MSLRPRISIHFLPIIHHLKHFSRKVLCGGKMYWLAWNVLKYSWNRNMWKLYKYLSNECIIYHPLSEQNPLGYAWIRERKGNGNGSNRLDRQLFHFHFPHQIFKHSLNKLVEKNWKWGSYLLGQREVSFFTKRW